jgi:hypothetical protein
MITRIFLSAALFVPLLGLPQAADSASSMGTFPARITIVSACSTQQALFGPQAQNTSGQVTVICQPGMTPFLTQSVDLGGADTGSNTSSGNQGGSIVGVEAAGASGGGGVAFDLVSKNEVLSPPLPSASTFASKVIYVMF